MTITCDTQTTVSHGPHDDYVQCRFSNGFECNIPASWPQPIIDATIQGVLDAFDSDAPPQNWVPYDGYVAP